VTSEERGRIGQVAGGDEGVSVATQFRSPDMDLLALISAWEKKSKAASAEAGSFTISGTASRQTAQAHGVRCPGPREIFGSAFATASISVKFMAVPHPALRQRCFLECTGKASPARRQTPSPHHAAACRSLWLSLLYAMRPGN